MLLPLSAVTLVGDGDGIYPFGLGFYGRGNGGITIPRGVQGVFRCCTEGCDLVGNVGLDDLRCCFQPW